MRDGSHGVKAALPFPAQRDAGRVLPHDRSDPGNAVITKVGVTAP